MLYCFIQQKILYESTVSTSSRADATTIVITEIAVAACVLTVKEKKGNQH